MAVGWCPCVLPPEQVVCTASLGMAGSREALAEECQRSRLRRVCTHGHKAGVGYVGAVGLVIDVIVVGRHSRLPPPSQSLPDHAMRPLQPQAGHTHRLVAHSAEAGRHLASHATSRGTKALQLPSHDLRRRQGLHPRCLHTAAPAAAALSDACVDGWELGVGGAVIGGGDGGARRGGGGPPGPRIPFLHLCQQRVAEGGGGGGADDQQQQNQLLQWRQSGGPIRSSRCVANSTDIKKTHLKAPAACKHAHSPHPW